MTPIAWKMPEFTVSSGRLNDPRSSFGTMAPWTTTVTMMTIMLTRANVLALASFAMSRYSVSGYDTDNVKTTITTRRSVSRPSTGTSCRPGHTAVRTCGMLSPTITPKATMPPNANTHCARLMAISPVRPKQCSTVPWKLLAPLSLLLTTISRIVQSTSTVSTTSSTTPATSPACFIAYGCPMMPAPMMLLAMFMNALLSPDLGRLRSRSAHSSTSTRVSISPDRASVTEGASMSVSSGKRC